jgi:nitrite reductase (cytochrome c-552)
VSVSGAGELELGQPVPADHIARTDQRHGVLGRWRPNQMAAMKCDHGMAAILRVVDFIEAENSMGFHAGAEAARILAKSIDYLRQGQIAIRDTGPLARTK